MILANLFDMGIVSNNPILNNITDYLIEEASAEEEELLGMYFFLNSEQFSNLSFSRNFFKKVKTMIWKMEKKVRKAIRLSVTKNWSKSWTSYSFISESSTAWIFTVAVNIHTKMRCPTDVVLCMLEEFHQPQM